MNQAINTEINSVLFVLTGLTYGGAEVQVRDLAIEHKRRNTEVSIVTLMHPVAHVEKLNSHGIEVLDLGMSRGIPNIFTVRRFNKYVKKTNPDVVHAHMVHAIVFTRIARLLGVKMKAVVSSAHNTIDSGWLLKLLYKLTDRWSDNTTNVCQAAVDAFIAQGLAEPSRIRVMHNGISHEPVSASSQAAKRKAILEELGIDDTFLWLTIGRMDDDQKDFPFLIETYKRPVFSNSKLLIVGTGTQIEKLKALVRISGVRDRIIFLGIRKDARELMVAVDAFVLPSKWEGLPIVLLEAAVASLPVVCTDVGGNTDIINENTGRVIESGSIRQLTKAMLEIEQLPVDQRKLMGSNSAKFVTENFELTKIVDNWVDLYLSLQKG